MRTTPLFLALCLAGCATGAKFEERMNSFLGAREGDLVASYGPPQGFYAAPDGSRILTFSRSSTAQIGGQTQYQPVTSTTTGTLSNGYRTSNYTANTTSYQAVQAPVYNLNYSCTVNFKLVNDRVQSWQAQGNHCVAK